MTTIRLLVCGPRLDTDRARCFSALDQVRAVYPIELLMHGDCHIGGRPSGSDSLADAWARDRGVPLMRFKVDHSVDGRWPAAGPARNSRQLRLGRPTAGVAFSRPDCSWGPGTADMVRRMHRASVPVWECSLTVEFTGFRWSNPLDEVLV